MRQRSHSLRKSTQRAVPASSAPQHALVGLGQTGHWALGTMYSLVLALQRGRESAPSDDASRRLKPFDHAMASIAVRRNPLIQGGAAS